MNELVIKKVDTKKELNEAFDIRKKVFVEEQNVPEELELDEFEEIAEHFIAYLNKNPIGCARIRIFNNFVKLERIAILKEYRNKGYGSQLTKYLIDKITKDTQKDVIIHSQEYAKNFYKKFGFKIIGNPFYEAGLKHVKMVLYY